MATIPTNVTRSFSDLDLNFTIHPVKKDVNRNLNEMAIINSVKNLILTNHFERPFRPTLGSNVRKLLFENGDVITSSALEREIEQIIQNNEPRVKTNRIEVVADLDNNGFKVYLEFFVINRPEPISINFFLERVR